MENPRLSYLKEKYPDKEYPASLYKIWTAEEIRQLLEELKQGIDKKIIAQNHDRSIGGINARIEKIAYIMHTQNQLPIEIIGLTGLDELTLLDIIIKKEKRENEASRKSQIKKNKETTISIDSDTNKVKTEIKEMIEMKTELTEMKTEIKKLNNTIKELVEMMKAVYEFDDA